MGAGASAGTAAAACDRRVDMAAAGVGQKQNSPFPADVASSLAAGLHLRTVLAGGMAATSDLDMSGTGESGHATQPLCAHLPHALPDEMYASILRDTCGYPVLTDLPFFHEAAGSIYLLEGHVAKAQQESALAPQRVSLLEDGTTLLSRSHVLHGPLYGNSSQLQLPFDSFRAMMLVDRPGRDPEEEYRNHVRMWLELEESDREFYSAAARAFNAKLFESQDTRVWQVMWLAAPFEAGPAGSYSHGIPPPALHPARILIHVLSHEAVTQPPCTPARPMCPVVLAQELPMAESLVDLGGPATMAAPLHTAAGDPGLGLPFSPRYDAPMPSSMLDSRRIHSCRPNRSGPSASNITPEEQPFADRSTAIGAVHHAAAHPSTALQYTAVDTCLREGRESPDLFEAVSVICQATAFLDEPYQQGPPIGSIAHPITSGTCPTTYASDPALGYESPFKECGAPQLFALAPGGASHLHSEVPHDSVVPMSYLSPQMSVSGTAVASDFNHPQSAGPADFCAPVPACPAPLEASGAVVTVNGSRAKQSARSNEGADLLEAASVLDRATACLLAGAPCESDDYHHHYVAPAA